MSRIIAITGASSGIGRSTADRLIGAGHKVVGNARRADKLKEMANQYNKNGNISFLDVAGDATKDETINDVFLQSRNIFGSVPTAFIINAGHGLPGTPNNSDPTLWQSLLDTNILGVLKQMRAASSEMIRDYEQNGIQARDIVILGSSIGRNVSPFNSVYGATKAAVHSLAEALRRELCSKMIRVSLIEPGIVETEFQSVAKYDPEWFKKYSEEIGPILTSDDIARIIEFIVMQPSHVHINDVMIRPTRQAYP